MKKQSSTLSGSRGRTGHPPACGQDTQLCIHMACTRTSRLCPCTVHLQLLFRHNAPPYRTTNTCFCAMHGHTSATRSGHTLTNRNPCTQSHAYPAPAIRAHAYSCLGTCMDNTYIHSRNACVWTQTLTAHNSGPPDTHTHTQKILTAASTNIN